MTVLLPPSPGEGMDVFFNARSIAVIGASSEFTKIGGRPIHLLRKYGYSGDIYPINPKGGTIQGLPAYASVLDTPTAPDLAILAVPVEATLQAVRDCAKRGVRGVIVLTSGFAEAGPEGIDLQAELVRVARSHGMRLLGPNCLGTVNVVDKLVGSFSIALEQNMPPAGHVGIVSQSGNIGSFTMSNMAQRGLGVSRFIATGNEADVDVADGLLYLTGQAQVKVILLYIEGVRDGVRFLEGLRRAHAAGQAVVAIKLGRTAVGSAAAASHTAALAGSDAVADAVLRQFGAYRAQSIEEFFDIACAAAVAGMPRNGRTGIVTVSGGVGVLLAESLPPPQALSAAASTQAASRALGWVGDNMGRLSPPPPSEM